MTRLVRVLGSWVRECHLLGVFVTVIELAMTPGQAVGTFRVEVVRSPAGEASAVVALDVEPLLAQREQPGAGSACVGGG